MARDCLPTLLYVFIIIPPVFIASLGIAWFFSAIGVFIRDIRSVRVLFRVGITVCQRSFLFCGKSESSGSCDMDILEVEPINSFDRFLYLK